MKEKDWNVGIVVPAHNEEQLVDHCVSALKTICKTHKRKYKNLRFLIVADSCTDKTEEIVQELIQDAECGQLLSVRGRNVGKARSIGCSKLFTDFRDERLDRIWIANTDADCLPSSDWLEAQMIYAQLDYQAVAGVIEVPTLAKFNAQLLETFTNFYKGSGDHHHDHIHGANLGIRGDAYLAVGGWEELALSEDLDLWNKLKMAKASIISSRLCSIQTSPRLKGRATGGFADFLSQMALSC